MYGGNRPALDGLKGGGRQREARPPAQQQAAAVQQQPQAQYVGGRGENQQNVGAGIQDPNMLLLAATALLLHQQQQQQQQQQNPNLPIPPVPAFSFQNPHCLGFQNPSAVVVPNVNLSASPCELEQNLHDCKKKNKQVVMINKSHSGGKTSENRALLLKPLSKQKLEKMSRKNLIGRADKMAKKVWKALVADRKNVSALEVSTTVLAALQSQSWEPLGIQMQEVPSLSHLIAIEGKVNAFIHCFVGVRRITSLYDLDVAICQNQGVNEFEELELGPFLRHPLVLHYFQISHPSKIIKISSEEIVQDLSEFLDTRLAKGSRRRKEDNVDDFLSFVAEKRSIKKKEKLGVRIQSLRMHSIFIQKAKGSEHEVLKRWQDESFMRSNEEWGKDNSSSSRRTKCNSKRGKSDLFLGKQKSIKEQGKASPRPLEKDRDTSFSATSQEPVQKQFCGKHIRFASLSSEDEENGRGNNVKISSESINVDDGKSRCPYPSEIEETFRLGLGTEDVGQPVHASDYRGTPINKRKLQTDANADSPHATKFLKANSRNLCLIEKSNMTGEVNHGSRAQILHFDTLKVFISTWKETFKNNSVAEVLGKMLHFYEPRTSRRRKQIKKWLFSSYPCVQLLNIAMAAIKFGVWDNIFDTLQDQDINSHEIMTTGFAEYREYLSSDVQSGEKTTVCPDLRMQQTRCVTEQEILSRIASYYVLHDDFQSFEKPSIEENLNCWRKLCHCETWLIEQFGLEEFGLLGYGQFLVFLRNHICALPTELQNLLAGCACEKSSFEVYMLQIEFLALLSQGSNSLWENETVTKQMISSLLTRQFPMLLFNVVDKNLLENTHMVGEHDRSPKCLIFSATLLATPETSPNEENTTIENVSDRAYGDRAIAFCTVSSKDAIKVLLRAPMLYDLNAWSHWDVIFGPSLGPLVKWLVSEADDKDLYCLITKDGMVIRINQSATVDSFLEAALQRSSFQTAVELLSVLALAGGEKHVAKSLLKCYSKHAFEGIYGCGLGNVEVKESDRVIPQKKATKCYSNDLLATASRFLLECLGYLPPEFWGFATDILLSGMQFITKDAPSAILSECFPKERLMLHEIGLRLGIMNWINDYHAFYSTDIAAARSSVLTESNKLSSVHLETTPFEKGIGIKEGTIISCRKSSAVVGSDGIHNNYTEELSDVSCKEAAETVEATRKDKFVLDSKLSRSIEKDMLRKQHTPLGTALHCPLQELNSQDPNFLLELVQNADDNIYPENVEPAITFILNESGIVVLNNEVGFSAKDIQALLGDIGNSTKKRSDVRQTGNKGIRFKSVFQVTDTPELHSNGFHIKLDISKGHVGFVLPTVVPPCNIDRFCRMVSNESDKMDSKYWKTCILLPFRSKEYKETVTKMFSDLHPSLLLFLHRLRCIAFHNMLDDSLIITRKEILEDGIVNVTYGKNKTVWLLASRKLPAHITRPEVPMTEIAIAFTIEESNNGEYSPCLDQKPVFSSQSLRDYGLKFTLQGDFVLHTSREEVDKNNPWNEWLLTRFPSLFVRAERAFLALSCFRGHPGRAVTAYMSFVPLLGEVHGFSSGLARAIISELRKTSCLPLEGNSSRMVRPCDILRGWDGQAHTLLPGDLLQKHLDLGYLDSSVVISDSLARALGITQYGPDILIQFLTALCCYGEGMKSMGMLWLSSLLHALDSMLSSGEVDQTYNLQHIPFIPLADGTYSSVSVNTIWLLSDSSTDDALGLDAFPNLYARLRIVDPALIASAVGSGSRSKVTRMLHKIGVKLLSAHDIITVYILPALSEGRPTNWHENLVVDYLCFIVKHLQSGCSNCYTERKDIISKLQKAYLLTNYGYKKTVDTSIHFSRGFGNPVDVRKLITGVDMTWHEVDERYLQHPANSLITSAQTRWRELLQEIGVTDFVRVVQVDKSPVQVFDTILKDGIIDRDMISPESLVKDWESHEMAQLLSLLSIGGNRECCKYLLEVLDTVWDATFSGKATGYLHLKAFAEAKPFKSSFMRNICEVQWVVSSMDNELHYPKDLFYDCDAVRSILGASVPYALPKVKSSKLIVDMGFKTNISLKDALRIIDRWRKSKTNFKASIAQMSKLYKFMWDEMASSKKKSLKVLNSGQFIFLPLESVWPGDLVSGVFLSPEEVCWRDPTGSFNQKESQLQCTSVTQHLLQKALSDVYPSLRDFFVNVCGVSEVPSCNQYFDILQELSAFSLPSQAAGRVFRVFSELAVQMASGVLSLESIIHLKKRLTQSECRVLPTAQEKWVSLHQSDGILCWCDDENLKMQFEKLDGINFLDFGTLGDKEHEMLQMKVALLMQNLGISSLSKLVSRKAYSHGVTDSSLKASLVNWALPYAQRYIHTSHPDKYTQFKQSGFIVMKELQVSVVKNLYYQNSIRVCGSTSKKQHECSCLLEGSTLYTKVETDSHALFLELSRLFFDDNPDLPLANFIYMITTMAESGSTEEQTEKFIVDGQKIPKLPDKELEWSLSYSSPLANYKGLLRTGSNERKVLKRKRGDQVQNNSWPQANWKSAPGFNYGCLGGFKTSAAIQHHSHSNVIEGDDANVIDMDISDDREQFQINADVEDDGDSRNGVKNLPIVHDPIQNVAVAIDPVNLCLFSDGPELGSSTFGRREQLQTGTVDQAQAMLTGRLGESVAYKYLSDQYKREVVMWVNGENETGLPYDIVIGDNESTREYIEVKTTRLTRKDWFMVSPREWQFAVERGDSFSILHVVLLNNNTARITRFRNPLKQCQLRKLRLVLMIPKEE